MDELTPEEIADIQKAIDTGVYFGMGDGFSKVTEIFWKPGEPNALAQAIIDDVTAGEMSLVLDGHRFMIRKLDMLNEEWNGPIRLCCGQRHWEVQCPDGAVMCCICFMKFGVESLSVLPDGSKTDVCKTCAEQEERTRRMLEENKKIKLIVPDASVCKMVYWDCPTCEMEWMGPNEDPRQVHCANCGTAMRD